MTLEPLQYALGAGSGVLVGFTLGFVGGGGSILAIPLLMYLVGVGNPHVAVGTSAVAVAANAGAGLISHARAANVNWRCASMYASTGIAGALAGSNLGKALNGGRLLFLFAIVMVVVGILMLRRRDDKGDPAVKCDRRRAPKVMGLGLGTGLFSGFFGIGGGFLIVPGLVASTGMPITNAIGSSLVVVMAFGLTTGISYAAAGLVDWPLALAFSVGGLFGSIGGSRAARSMAKYSSKMTVLFVGVLFAVAGYMFWKNLGSI